MTDNHLIETNIAKNRRNVHIDFRQILKFKKIYFLFRIHFLLLDRKTYGQFGILSKIVLNDELYLDIFIRQIIIPQSKLLA